MHRLYNSSSLIAATTLCNSLLGLENFVLGLGQQMDRPTLPFPVWISKRTKAASVSLPFANRFFIWSDDSTTPSEEDHTSSKGSFFHQSSLPPVTYSKIKAHILLASGRPLLPWIPEQTSLRSNCHHTELAVWRASEHWCSRPYCCCCEVLLLASPTSGL